MMARLSDTSPEANKVQAELLRQAPVWRKLELLGQLNEMAKSLAKNSLRQLYPDADDSELHRRLADRVLGAELAAAVYGPLPVESESREDINADVLKITGDKIDQDNLEQWGTALNVSDLLERAFRESNPS